MKRVEFVEHLLKIQAAEIMVSDDGQKEYAHDADNCFANFDSDADHGVSRLQSIATHLNKHMRGIKAFVNGHRSQREDIRGRIKDARLYLALLWGAIEDEERQAEAAQQDFLEEMEGRPLNGLSDGTAYPIIDANTDDQGWLYGADPLEELSHSRTLPQPLSGPRYSDIVLAPPKKLD